MEILPKDIERKYNELGVDFYKSDELFAKGLVNNDVFECMNDAFGMIRQIPSLFRTVVELVKSIHLIKLESDDYDVSFSEPQLPFSIFVSVPQKNSEISALRV